MNKLYYLLLLASVAVSLGSCTVTSNTATCLDVQSNAVSVTMADMKVDPERKSATTEWSWNPFTTIAGQKETAAAKLLNSTGGDVLVEPIYEIERRGLFRGGRITVTGHSATFDNFHPMTRDEAETLAIFKGKIPACTNVINNSGQSLINASPKPRERKTIDFLETTYEKGRRSFLSLIAGGTSVPEYNSDNGYGCPNVTATTLGIMYGNYGRRWGWYGKATVNWASLADRYDEDTYHAARPMLTFGAIKTLPCNFNLFAGAGIGGSIYKNSYGYANLYDTFETDFRIAVPIEAGIQWNFGNFNILAGYTYNISTDKDGDWYPHTYSVFGGIGFNF